MRLTTKQIRPGVVVFEMTGSIRMGPICQQIEQAVDELIHRHETSAIFDLSGVSYVDSSGVGTIVKSLTKLKKLGGTLRLSGVTGMVEGVLKLTQIDRVIEIYPTAAEASQDLPPVSNP